jgi:transposase
MVADAASLPREPDILIGMIVELRDENSRLQGLLATMKRALFGARSEKFDPDAAQLPLGLEDLSTLLVEPPAAAAASPAPGQSGRPKPARNIGGLPKHLAREDIVLEPETKTCPCCQGVLHRIGEDVSEMLDIVPAVIRVQRIRRPRYGCRGCEGAVVQAPAPARPVDGGCRRQLCWSMLQYQSLPGTCRYIARFRCWQARAFTSIDRPWCIGSSGSPGG